MRVFLRPAGLDRLSTEARVVYTAFAAFMLIGYASSAWLYLDDDLGLRPAPAARYYLGDVAVPLSTSETDGPTVVLPPDATVIALNLAKPARQVIETFHFHVFTAPLCLLVIAHLFMMCALAVRVKVALIVIAHLSLLAHLVAPLAVRLVSPKFAVVVFPSATVMGLSFLVLTVWPLIEMWRRLPEPPEGASPPG